MTPGRDLVVAHQARQDGQAGRIGTRPAVRAGAALERRSQVAPLPAVQVPSTLAGREQLVEPALVALDHQDVAIRATLDERRGGIG